MAQTSSHLLGRRIPIENFVTTALSNMPISFSQSNSYYLYKQFGGVPTGPVTTCRDLVVHVPVNFGVLCALTTDTRTAPATNSVLTKEDIR